MDACPTYEMMLEFYEGHTDTVQTAIIKDHLDSGCPACQKQMAFFKRALPALGSAYRLQAPERIQNAARRLFRTQPRHILIARLRPEPYLVPRFARGEAEGSFQRLYVTAEHDIDLWYDEQDARSRYLIGQILSRNDGRALTPDSATLHLADGSVLSATFEASEFHFADVPVGLCQLHLHLPDREIIVPEIAVGRLER